MLLGIAGALVAGFIGRLLGLYAAGQRAGVIMSTLGAILLLAVYRLINAPVFFGLNLCIAIEKCARVQGLASAGNACVCQTWSGPWDGVLIINESGSPRFESHLRLLG